MMVKLPASLPPSFPNLTHSLTLPLFLPLFLSLSFFPPIPFSHNDLNKIKMKRNKPGNEAEDK